MLNFLFYSKNIFKKHYLRNDPISFYKCYSCKHFLHRAADIDPKFYRKVIGTGLNELASTFLQLFSFFFHYRQYRIATRIETALHAPPWRSTHIVPACTHAPEHTARNYIVTPRVFNLSGAPPPPPTTFVRHRRSLAPTVFFDFTLSVPYNPAVLTPAETIFSRLLSSPHETTDDNDAPRDFDGLFPLIPPPPAPFASFR